jgi:DNA-directed RNA polymerase specialized sigma24 family protein
VDGGVVDVSSLLSARELGEAVAEELRRVSPKLREAFLLVRLDGLTHAEAALVLEISEGSTKVRTHRVTQWLRTRLARFLPSEERR